MDLATSKKKQTLSSNRIYFFTVIFLIAFGLQPIYNKYFLEVSLDLQRQTAKMPKSLDSFFIVFYYLSKNETFFFIQLLVFNFMNSFKALILLSNLIIARFLSTFLKFMFIEPKPFHIYSYLFHNICESSWGSPCVGTISVVVFYLTLLRIVLENKEFKNVLLRVLLTISVFLMIIIIILSFLWFGLNSINQIMFSFNLGVVIVLFSFMLFEIDANCGETLLGLVKNFIYQSIFITACCLGIGIAAYFYATSFTIPKKYIDVILKKCPDTKVNELLNNENLQWIVLPLVIPVALLTIKLEYIYFFKQRIHEWQYFNFGASDARNDSFLSKFSFENTSQWNKTTFLYSFLRLLLIMGLMVVSLVPAYFVDMSCHIVLVMIVRVWLTGVLVVFNLFFVSKVLATWMKLTNSNVIMLYETEDEIKQ